MRDILLLNIAVVLSFGAIAQDTPKKQIAACVERELKKARVTEPFSIERKVTCRAGYIKNLSCKRTDKNEEVKYLARAGFEIIQKPKVEGTSTDRGSVGSLSWSSKLVTVPISCRGNGCDKGDREWSSAVVSGTIQRIPTEDDRKSAMDNCLDEVLK